MMKTADQTGMIPETSAVLRAVMQALRIRRSLWFSF